MATMNGKEHSLVVPYQTMEVRFFASNLDVPQVVTLVPGRSADRDSLRAGWTFFILKPGTYHLTDDWRATGAGLTFIVPRGEPVVYAGTVHTALKGNWLTEGVASPAEVVDETAAARKVAVRMGVGDGRIATSLLRSPGSPPSQEALAGAVPFGIEVSDGPELTSPDWRGRAFAKFGVPQDPGRAFDGLGRGGGDGRGALGVMLVYLAYLPFGSAMAAHESNKKHAQWAPCLQSLAAELRELNPAGRIRSRAAAKTNVAGTGRLTLTVQRVCLRETKSPGTVCTEVAVRAQLEDTQGRRRFDQTYLVSNAAGIADPSVDFPAPHELLVPPAMAPRRRQRLEESDGRAVFRADVETALDAIVSRVLQDVRTPRDGRGA